MKNSIKHGLEAQALNTPPKRGNSNRWQTTHDLRVEYQDLPRGDYTFEVEAVDRDLVYSKAPATVALIVHLPYERMGLLSALGIAVILVAWQTVRVIRRDRRLQASNAALSNANKGLFGLNQELQRERAVERIRAQVQTMDKASDFDGVLAVLAEDLKGVGLNFDTCGIDVLDEEADEPTMANFEAHGFRYTTYKLDPEGTVTEEAYNISAPFPDVTRETIERFLAGEPWQGMSSGTAIVEVPMARYGRLRLTASNRQTFADEEIGALQDFASAIGLGYTRYLDFVNLESANREIQESADRKATFFASMSHELRTPITSMKGYVDNILDGIGGKANERHERYLRRVTDNASRLLELVNNLLDLSKVQAGRMDVDAQPFSVKKLITFCCGTVEPLVKPGVDLTYEAPDAVDEACTDEDKLRHVIGNLLSNAVKFTDEGEIGVRARTVHDQFIISVSDTGIGMPQEALSTIFDEFQQVKGSDQKQKGTGLGLAITKQYTELLGGTISVESEVGRGTTFTVQIPSVFKET